MSRVWVGLGSNIGDKAVWLRKALVLLRNSSRLVRVSSLYRTAPVGYLDQDWFLNGVAEVETLLQPLAFLHSLLATEQALNRVRTIRNGPRTIDLDILLWEDQVIRQPDLTVPHPAMTQRLFVLAPLAESAPKQMHPVLRVSVETLLARLNDPAQQATVWSDPSWAAGLMQPDRAKDPETPASREGSSGASGE
jgi:2-amino-4-hydroxy-6-hydroxymethyldihydropteridine diphosphokinase